jgi:hypothetical protein
VRPLIKNLARQMLETIVGESLEAMALCVQEMMQLRSRRRDLDASKQRPLTLHFLLSVATGPGGQRVRSLSEL